MSESYKAAKAAERKAQAKREQADHDLRMADWASRMHLEAQSQGVAELAMLAVSRLASAVSVASQEAAAEASKEARRAVCADVHDGPAPRKY